MKTTKNFFNKLCLCRLKFWQAIIFLFAMSLALTLFLFLLQPMPFSIVVDVTRDSHGLNIFLNWFPMFFAMLFLYFVGVGSASASTTVGAVAIALGFANRTKLLLRHDPLVPWDLLLGGEVVGIARSFGTNAILAVVGGIVLYILAAILFAFVIRSEKINWKIRVMGAVATLALPLILNAPLYSNPAVTNRLKVYGELWNQLDQFNSRGFVFSFINAFNTNRVMRPEGYDPNEVLRAIRKSDTSGWARLEGQQHPHIIMIMSEAFSDISLSPNFNFDDFEDPLENWQELKTEGIYGQAIVSVHGGGTAQTEFDVLTALNSRQFAGVPFAFRMITDEFESMASILNALGYRSEFMHPGFNWFYNRQNVYRHLGFSRLMFRDEFEGAYMRSGYISEYATISRLIEMFAEHRAERPGIPYFNFTVTIQNHGPYVDKYRWCGFDEVPNFATDLPLSDVDINALSNYFHGLKDADRQLRRLTDYLNAQDEPVVLVYFGDHLPALGITIYDTILPNVYEPGSFEDMTRMFRVPFLIWFNQAALELYEISHPLELTNPDEERVFSANFLGAYVMEVLGFTQLSPFWDWNSHLRTIFPVMMETSSFTPCRMVSNYMAENYFFRLRWLITYRDWSYFRIFDERRHESEPIVPLPQAQDLVPWGRGMRNAIHE